MPEIKIKVRDKCAEGEGVVICNNSDYTVVWDLDEEWTPYDTKTMRVNLADGTYQDVVFTGDTATLPVLTASGWVSVGLYAGDLHTTRAARLLALSSVLTPGGSPAAPAEDVYAQIMAKLNELSTVSPEDIAKAVEDYLSEHPAASASMRVEGGYIQFSADGKTWANVIALADLKGPKGDTGATGPQGPAGAGMDITGATVGQTVKIAAVDGNGVPTAWEPVDMLSGGGKTWEKLVDASLAEAVESVTYTFDNCKKVKALIAPTLASGEAYSGWTRISINNVSYPLFNYKVDATKGIYFAVDSVYPPYVQASLGTNSNTIAYGFIGGLQTTALANIAPNGVAELGCRTAELLKAGTKIEIWGVKS